LKKKVLIKSDFKEDVKSDKGFLNPLKSLLKVKSSDKKKSKGK